VTLVTGPRRLPSSCQRETPGRVPPQRLNTQKPSPGSLRSEEISTELLIFAQSKLGLRNPRLQWARERFLLNHPGSLNRRGVRNDVADCNDADNCDCECNDHPDGQLHEVATHGRSPIHRVRQLWCRCRYSYPRLSHKPVTHVIGARNFLSANSRNRVSPCCAKCAFGHLASRAIPLVSNPRAIKAEDSGCRGAAKRRSKRSVDGGPIGQIKAPTHQPLTDRGFCRQGSCHLAAGR
jgi:hypothetical protein